MKVTCSKCEMLKVACQCNSKEENIDMDYMTVTELNQRMKDTGKVISGQGNGTIKLVKV